MKKKKDSKPPKSHKAAAASGDDLFNQIVTLTGLPAQIIKKELKAILDRKNIDVTSLTLDQLRCVVASYMREIMGAILDRQTDEKHTEGHH